MKKVIVSSGISLVLALGFSACGNMSKNTKTTDANKETTTIKAANPEIVYVNADSLTTNYQYFKDIRAKYEAKGKKADADLNAKGQAFQREVVNYQQKAGTMTAEQRAETEKRLQRKQQELQDYQQKTGLNLQNEQAKDQEELYSAVETYLKKYAKDKGYKMVLSYQRGIGQILFADSSLDITNDVLKALNDEYKPKK